MTTPHPSSTAPEPDSVVASTTPDASAILEAVHLRKEFSLGRHIFGPPRAVHAVEDVSLELHPGRVTALVGESGSGKTTVARMLAQLYLPSGGEIRYRGEPVKGSSAAAVKAYRRHVQIVFQDPFSSLNPVHGVRYHLTRPLRIYGHVRSNEDVEAALASLLERVSLTPTEHFLDKFPHQLSGGQRQRIAIARALAAQPSVLLADEPVSMLDVSIRLGILNLLAKLKEEDRLAILYITHDIASARYFADETLVMYAGQLVEGGPSDHVIQQPAHPYTQLLIGAAPDPERITGNGGTRDGKVVAKGEPPSLLTPPTGCRFHTRCPHVMDICRQRFPARTELGGGHFTHCFLYGDNGAATPARAAGTDSEILV